MVIPSLISSFSVLGLEESLRLWPSDEAAIELYAFMKEDIGQLFPKDHDLHHRSAVCAMAYQWQKTRSIDCAAIVADNIVTLLSDTRCEAKIRSIASYIPELSNPVKRQIGIDALFFLIALAVCLKARGHEVKDIEIVGGSSTGAFGCAKNNRLILPVLFARTASRPGLIRFLTKSLTTSIRGKSWLKLAEEHDLKIGFELEPGSLQIFKDAESSINLIKLLRKSGYSCASLNLDIAHWTLVNETPASLDAAGAWPLISHIHVSDHIKAAFADVPFGSVIGQDKSDEWLNAIRKNSSDREMIVSVELEACQSIQMVKTATDRIISFSRN